MEPGDKLQRIRPGDQWLFDADMNLVGVKNPKGHGEDLRPPRYATDTSGNVTGLVGPDGDLLLSWIDTNVPIAQADGGRAFVQGRASGFYPPQENVSGYGVKAP